MNTERGNIKIDPNQLRSMATNLENCCNELEEHLNNVGNEVTNLQQGGWVSQAGERLRERFNSLRTRYFQNYPQAMRDYCDFLRQTATEYEQADDRRKQEIEAMMNMQA